MIQKSAQQHRVPLFRSQSFQRAINFGCETSPQRRIWRQRRVRPAENPFPEASESVNALLPDLPAGDGGDVEEPTREHRVLPQLARSPGQNQEHRTSGFRGLGRIARPPQRRGMNEHQIAFD